MPGPSAPDQLQLVMFEDPEAEVWAVTAGGVLGLGGLNGGAGSTGIGGRALAVQLEGSQEDDRRLRGEAVELSLIASQPPLSTEGGVSLARCQVKGTAGSLILDGVGLVLVHPRLGRGESLRVAAAWLGEDSSLALAALRPARAKGHDRDAIAAAVWDGGPGDAAAQASVDPRLSVTSDERGEPLRVGLELWLGSDEEEAMELPHRATGEPVGEKLTLTGAGLEIVAHPLRWRGRGREGSGAYALVRAG